MAVRSFFPWLCACVLTVAAVAQPAAPLRGRSVQDVLEQLQVAGAPLVYSSNLVPDSLRVGEEPTATTPLAIAREILAPHGIEVREEGPLWLVVRAPPRPVQLLPGAVIVTARAAYSGAGIHGMTVHVDPPEGPTIAAVDGRADLVNLVPGRHALTVRAAGFLPEHVAVQVSSGEAVNLAVALTEAVPKLDEVIVAASRYEVSNEVRPSAAYFSRDQVENLASLGDDTVRVAQQLPGVASTEFSARPYVRGGAANELAVFLDGVRLIEPYHLRDLQSAFSVIDQRMVDNVAVHAGGFPAAYGSALSALMVIEPREPAKLEHELGLSVLYTSFLSSGTFADGAASWLAAVRSSNLDRVLVDERGQPKFADLFARVTLELGEHQRLVLGNLSFRDDVIATFDAGVAKRESASSDTDGRQSWIRLESDWTQTLSGSFTLFGTSFRSRRREDIADVAELIGAVDDERTLDASGVASEWRFVPSDRQVLRWGVEVEGRDARYRYSSSADRRGLLATLAAPTPVVRAVALSPEGTSYGAFVEDRVRVTDRLIAELGLRWDRQTYLQRGLDRQYSPRASLLYRVGSRTDVRVSYGRYFQPEGPVELQVEDGVTEFAPTQKATSTVVSFERRFAAGLAVRAEAYRKWTRDARPRYENLFDPLTLAAELRASRVRVAPERAEARGVELLVSGERPVSWWAGVSTAHVDDRIGGGLVPRSWDQEHALTAGVTWPIGMWNLSTTAVWHRGWPVTQVEIVTDPDGAQRVVAGPRNATRLPDVRRVDARASRDFEVGLGSLRFFAEVTNLTNHDNACCLVYEPVTSPGGATSLSRRGSPRVGTVGNFGVLWQF